MILSAIRQLPSDNVAISTSKLTVTYEELLAKVSLVSQWLVDNDIKVLLLESDNVPEWVYIDLACQQADVIFVPVPNFFSKKQVEHIISRVKPDLIVQPTDGKSLWPNFIFPLFQFMKFKYSQAPNVPDGTSKITFTSGSTGEPKGVCLSIENQYKVAVSLVKTIALVQPKHFCLLSFSTLLENIAGIYAPLLAGDSIHILKSDERGFNGAVISSPERLLSSMSCAQPQSIILVPELLQFFLGAIHSGWQAPASFEFIAVGGSRVSPLLLAQAKKFGLPVFQGYGLSECASVVSLCHRETDCIGAGQVLPHLTVTVDNGELVVFGNVFLGYLNDPNSWYQTAVRTGDLGQVSNKNIEILGRSSNLIINSFGRNISPEWVESEMLATGEFLQIVVFGDAMPNLIALVLARNPAQSYESLSLFIEQVNSILPVYAQISSFIQLEAPLSIEKGQITSNGRPRRLQIYQDFSQQIETLYKTQSKKDSEYELI